MRLSNTAGGSYWCFDLALFCLPCSSFIPSFPLFHFEALLHHSWNGINSEIAKVYLHLVQSQLCSSCPLNHCLQARQSNLSHATKQQGEKSSTPIPKHLDYCHFPGEPQWCGMTCDKQGSFQWKLGAGEGRELYRKSIIISPGHKHRFYYAPAKNSYSHE